MASTVRTRFAPSPTGYLHIGGVRTALFNWLYARRHGGQFILRIDDTDQARNVEAALAPILHGFRWLGLDWDEGPDVGGPHEPYYQSQRQARYQEAVEQLLASGHAYRDYSTPEETQAERESAEKEKRNYRCSRKWMADTSEKQKEFEAEGRKAVVRLKIPAEGKIVVDDLIRGRVEFDWANENDHVIQRPDGSCLYHLASVVDDHDYEITHVIRAEEHLPNTPRQIFIMQSLGYELPKFAHVPYVAAPGGKEKLSKRHIKKYLNNKQFRRIYESGQKIAERIGLEIGADTFNPVLVDFYEQVGYLPHAIVNYLVRLGWSLDDRTEFLSLPEMKENYSLERVVKAPASFDVEKLQAFQDHYMRQVPVVEKCSIMLDYLHRAGLIQDKADPSVTDKLTQIIEACAHRLVVYGDILDYADFFFVADENVTYDEKAFAKAFKKEGSADLLKKLRQQLAEADDFTAAALDDLFTRFVEAEEIKAKQADHLVRLPISGKAYGMSLYDALEILGKDATLARIDQALERV